MMANKIGEIIEIQPILQKHNGEIGCGTHAKICEYLNCQMGEVYAVFDDIENIYMGVMCKIKKDYFMNDSLSAFDKNDRIINNNHTIGYELNSMIDLLNYKYMMRLH